MCIHSARRANGTAASPSAGYDFMIAITEQSIQARKVGLSLKKRVKMLFIILPNRSTMKKSILIGSLSGPNFAITVAIRTDKMDHSRTDLTDLCFPKSVQKNQFCVVLHVSRNLFLGVWPQFWPNVCESARNFRLCSARDCRYRCAIPSGNLQGNLQRSHNDGIIELAC